MKNSKNFLNISFLFKKGHLYFSQLYFFFHFCSAAGVVAVAPAAGVVVVVAAAVVAVAAVAVVTRFIKNPTNFNFVI